MLTLNQKLKYLFIIKWRLHFGIRFLFTL